MKKKWKIQSKERNLIEFGMLYKPKDIVRIKTRAQLLESGVSLRYIIWISELCGKVFEIVELDKSMVHYRLKGSDKSVTDLEIYGTIIQ